MTEQNTAAGLSWHSETFQQKFSYLKHNFLAHYDDAEDVLEVWSNMPRSVLTPVRLTNHHFFMVSGETLRIYGVRAESFCSDLMGRAPKLFALWEQRRMAEALKQPLMLSYFPAQAHTLLGDKPIPLGIFRYVVNLTWATAHAELVL